MRFRLLACAVCLVAAGCSQSPDEPADSPHEAEVEPESAEVEPESAEVEPESAAAPEPQLPSAPWDEAPVPPPAFVSDAAGAWALHVGWCNMLAPTSVDAAGQDWHIEFLGVFRTGQADFSISGDGTEIGLSIWPLDEPEVQRYFEPDVSEQRYAGGSLQKSLDAEHRLIAIPGEECFYELSLREWNMASLGMFFDSLRRIDA